MAVTKIMRCKKCRKTPSEISEYVQFGKMNDCTPEEYVLQEEGTLNEETGEFYCTKCYIEIGMPLGTA